MLIKNYDSLLHKFIFILLVLLSVSCVQTQNEIYETPTSGLITLSADESFLLIVKAEVRSFEYLYPEAKIKIQYQSESEAVMSLLNNKVDLIIISRELNNKEKEFVKEKKINIRTNKIAMDAIAIIVNNQFSDSIMTIFVLKEIISGNINKWNQLSTSLPDKNIEIIVDKNNSSNLNFLKSKMQLNSIKSKIYAAGSNKEVMEYVRKNKSSLGIIGVNWISDDDDPQLSKKLQQIKVLAIAEGAGKNPSKYYQPIQNNLTEGRYVLTRPLYLISKNVKTGLCAGFASFILSDPGQRIVLKSGLLPAIMPGREIVIKRN